MLRLEREHADQMVAHSLEEEPNECCGILTGSDDVVSKAHRITNTAKSPFRYLMDPQEQLNVMLESERSGQEILAFYHSHTHSPAFPSPTDVRMAQQSGWLLQLKSLVCIKQFIRQNEVPSSLIGARFMETQNLEKPTIFQTKTPEE